MVNVSRIVRAGSAAFAIRSMLLSEINGGHGLSVLIDVGEVMDNGAFEVPIYTSRNL